MSEMSFDGGSLEVPRIAPVPRRTETSKKAPKNHNYVKWIGALAGLSAVTLGGLWAGNKLQNYEQGERNKKLAGFQAIETTQLSNATRQSVKLSQNVILLEAGVAERTTPFMIDNSRQLGISVKGNVAARVPKGHEQVVVKPLVYTDQLNTTWLGFTVANGEKNTETKSPVEVANDMVWVNASKLGPNDAKIVSRQSDKLLPFSVATVLEHLQESTLDNHGQFMSEEGNPIAWAPEQLTFEIAHRADVA